MCDVFLTKKERILRHSDFKKIYDKGGKSDTEHFLVFINPNGLGWRRLGVTVSKKIGNAVNRNHVKRLLREYFRLHKARFPQSSDILIVAKVGAQALKYNGLCVELDTLSKRWL